MALWPTRADVWREQGRPAQQQLIELLLAVQSFHPVLLGATPRDLVRVRANVPAEIPLLPINYNDAWPRDIGPLWCQPPSSGLVAQGFGFTAWGGLYQEHQHDRQFARGLARQLAVRYQADALVLEGGAITHDGQGTVIVHARSVARNNPQLRRAQLEYKLKQLLDVKQVHWLEWAHPADETGGHVDNQMLFADERSLVCACPPPESPFYRHYQSTIDAVRQLRGGDGRPYRIIELPQPGPLALPPEYFVTVRRHVGVRRRGELPVLPSYVNFIRLPQAILVPQFGLASDKQALTTMRSAFPELQVSGIAASEFIMAGGGPHCMTLNLP
ncbi:MAG: agmatine deiminase family protein [Pseudidiomarina sp.]|nr:agmatine deiminase family protein [Pseudidiomarina sp.]